MENPINEGIEMGELVVKTSIFSRVSNFFLSLKIADKILIGFLVGSTIPVLLGIFSISTLNHLNGNSRLIIEKNDPLIRISEDLIDSALAQQLYGGRYGLSGKEEMLRLFRARSIEFKKLLEEAKGLPGEESPYLSDVSRLHNIYENFFEENFKQMSASSSAGKVDLGRELATKQEPLLQLIKKMNRETLIDHKLKMTSLSNAVKNAYYTTMLICALGIIVGVGAATLITRNISESIEKLKFATRKIAEGDFEHIPKISQMDELWELANEFKYMGSRLRHLEVLHLDASPLTKLPGGTAIENILEKRLKENMPTTFCLLDLDNFKAYNDHYGYAKGSELIKATAHVIKDVVDFKGNLSDFVGHIGGDDFAIITSPESSRKICDAVIKLFDRVAPTHYSTEDRERGYIMGETRQGEKAEFPMVSISIAAVSNKGGKISSHIEMGELAAELKEAAKKIPGSSYLEDRRTHNS